MPRPAKAAFVAAASTALLCIVGYIVLAIYLETHRPGFPEGLNCWPMQAMGLIYVTRFESVVINALRYTGFVATLIAVALDISLRFRR